MSLAQKMEAKAVARSFFLSFALHSALLALLFLYFFLSEPSARISEPEPRLTVRPLKVAERPKTPKIDPGFEVPAATPQARELNAQVTPEVDPETETVEPEKIVEAPLPQEPEPSQHGGDRPRPQLLLPEPDYPTRPVNERSMPSDLASVGSGPTALQGEDLGKDRPAVPYYHPAVTLDGVSDRAWILVKFEIEANGRFEVEILEGTGDIHKDARALRVLERWKWLPMRIEGENLASVEVVRLFRRDVTAR